MLSNKNKDDDEVFPNLVRQAISEKNLLAIQGLIPSYVNPETTIYGSSFLSIALGQDADIEVVRLLIDLKVPINMSDEDDPYRIPLRIAIQHKNVEAISLLIQHGADPYGQWSEDIKE